MQYLWPDDFFVHLVSKVHPKHYRVTYIGKLFEVHSYILGDITSPQVFLLILQYKLNHIASCLSEAIRFFLDTKLGGIWLYSHGECSLLLLFIHILNLSTKSIFIHSIPEKLEQPKTIPQSFYSDDRALDILQVT